MMPCRHAIPEGDHAYCQEQDVPCTGSYPGNLISQDEMCCYDPICLWEVYQANQTYENCCRWLKHRAWMRVEGCT